MLNIAAEASVMVTRAMDRWPPTLSSDVRIALQMVKYLMFVPSGMFIAVTSSPMQGAHPLIIYQDGPEPPCMAGVRPNGYRLPNPKIRIFTFARLPIRGGVHTFLHSVHTSDQLTL